MTELQPLDVTPGQRARQKAKIGSVIDLKKNVLYSAPSLFDLKASAQDHLIKLFKPDRALITVNRDHEFPALDKLIEAALEENRLIYVPNLEDTRAIVTGQIPTELHNLFSLRLSPQEVNPAALRSLPFGSVAVAPLVTGLNRRLPVEQYDRYGTLVLCAERAEMLDPLSDMVPLRMYADYFAIAFEHLSEKSK